jgi:lipopolysaccharide/colanic/teichoic acid biosynthesis glycosyltransferase
LLCGGPGNLEPAFVVDLKLIRRTKIRLQLKYVRERSFWTDLKIIFLTSQALLKPQSAAVKELRTGASREMPV